VTGRRPSKSLFARFEAARQRRRSSATFDSPLRRVVRRIERQIKFLVFSPLAMVVRPRRASFPLDITKIKSILILRYDALGDAVISSAVWHAVHRYNPNARIGVVASTRNQMLIKADPVVSDVFLYSKGLSWKDIREMWRARRATKWEVVLNIYYHDKTRGVLYAKLVAPRAITATGVHSRHDRYRRIYSFVGNREGPEVPIAMQWISLLQQLFGITLADHETYPTIFADAEIERTFSHEIATKLAAEGKQEYIVINTDAAQAFREWGFENALELSKEIVNERPDLKIFWTSAPGNSENVRSFLAAHQIANVEYLLTPSVDHLLVAVKSARAVISPDTSVVHIAAAYKRPTVGLYVERNPFPIRGTISRMLFAPDGRTTRLISVANVLEALREVLREST
jgi:ADP-heptose:LPS heptosyltransferase